MYLAQRNAPPQTAVSSVNSNARHKPILFTIPVLVAADLGTKPAEIPSWIPILAVGLERKRDARERRCAVSIGSIRMAQIK
jgi:hypothetical protein